MRQDPIQICAYDPQWPLNFERERRRITPILLPWLAQPIEHIGSTSVPGLAAKPIIDMVAVVNEVSLVVGARGALEDIEWMHAPEPGDEAERKLSFCFPCVEIRTHHLHVVEASSGQWRGWLAFRDYLRAHPEAVREYAALKERLARQYGSDPNDRDAYRSGKTNWVQTMTSEALAEGSQKPLEGPVRK